MITWFKALDMGGKAMVILCVALLAVVAIGTATHLIDAAFETAEQKGAIVERAAGNAKTLENVEKANAARKTYRSDPALRDADCLLDATNPQDC
jgi:hypothetical protein